MAQSIRSVSHVSFDAQRAQAFQERLTDMLNSGAMSLMISVGHRTGLFDAMADSGSATSGQIAGRTGLQERYVREWLGAMTVGRGHRARR